MSVDKDRFERYADAAHENQRLRQELIKARHRAIFKADQSYYDGLLMGGLIGFCTGMIICGLLVAIF